MESVCDAVQGPVCPVTLKINNNKLLFVNKSAPYVGNTLADHS